MNTDAKVLATYDAAWKAKLDEIRSRPRGTPMIPYEAHLAGLWAVTEQAWEDEHG